MKYKQIISCAILASLGILAACTPPLPAPTPTAESVVAESPTATAPLPAPAPTLEPTPVSCGSLEEPRCSLQQAESLAGFQIRVPTRLPEGLVFLGALAEPGTTSTLVYGCGEDCRLLIDQQIDKENWFWSEEGLQNRKGELAVIGSHRGEYLTGSSDAASSTITPFGDPAAATQVLQWGWDDNTTRIDYGFWISLFGTPAEGSQLDREGLIELAYDTVGVPFPTGLIAFESNRDGNGEIYAMRFHSKVRINLSNHPAADHSFAWSPDGEQIAFLSDRSGALEVFVMRPDGSSVLQLTEGSGVDWVGPPAWSPDGEGLALIGAAPEHGEGAGLVYLVNTDGSGYSLLSDEPVYTSQPLRWSPDGKWIAYSEYFLDPESGGLLPAPVSSGLKAIAAQGGRRIQLSGRENKMEGRENAVVGGFAWSPDGQKLAYAWMDDPLYFRNFHVAIANADGSDPKNISLSEEYDPPSDLAWSPDGSLLAFIWSDENSLGMLTVYDYLEDEVVSNVGINTSEVSRLSWSPTGMQILFALNWDINAEPSHWISAALLEENAKVFSPPSRLSVVEIIDLEGSDAGTGDNAFPQWQPRP